MTSRAGVPILVNRESFLVAVLAGEEKMSVMYPQRPTLDEVRVFHTLHGDAASQAGGRKTNLDCAARTPQPPRLPAWGVCSSVSAVRGPHSAPSLGVYRGGRCCLGSGWRQNSAHALGGV